MKRRVIICLALFIAAFVVRVIVWQNNKIGMATVQWVVTENYLGDARTLAAGDIRTFLAGPNPPSNARVIDHPPGYPLMIRVIYAVFGEGDAWHVLQLALSSLAAALLFIIAALLFNERIGIMAGVLAALAPQLAYNSGLMLPDELSVIPILAAVYFLVRAIREPRAFYAILCGVCLGLSCWLRSNGLLLPLFFGVAAVILITKVARLRFAALIVAAFVVTIGPITIRNALYFNDLIPLSLGSGTTFVEGLGDIDDGSRSLPRTDEDVMRLDAQLNGSGNQYSGLYDIDGVGRDRRRLRFGLSKVASEPLWFARGVAARGSSTFRLERVPAIAAEQDEKATTPTVLYWLNTPLKVLQHAFVTAVFLPLVILGLFVMAMRKQWRELIVILVVPLYFATVQPLVHTEYRYVLATPHVLMIAAAVALCWLFGKIAGLVPSDRESSAGA